MTFSMYRLQEALPADAPGIAELEEELFPDNWMSSGTILNEFERGPAFIMANNLGAVAAYVLTNIEEGILDVLRVGVTKDFQGYGWGILLMHRVLLVPHRACVLTVRKDNRRAISLYKKLKFELHGETAESLVLLRTSSRSTRVHTPRT